MIYGSYVRYVNVLNDSCLIAFITNTIVLVLVQLIPLYRLFGNNRKYVPAILYLVFLFIITNFVTFVLVVPFTGVLWLAYEKLIIFNNLLITDLSFWIVSYLVVLWLIGFFSFY